GETQQQGRSPPGAVASVAVDGPWQSNRALSAAARGRPAPVAAVRRRARRARTAAARPAARPRLPAVVGVDPDQLVRRADHDARAAAYRGGAAARDADSDGRADRDGGRAVRAVLVAGGRLARSRAKAPGVRG